MSSDNQKALKAGTWYVVSNFLNKGVLALSTPVITRLLTTAEYGVAGTYNSLLSIYMILATLDLRTSVAMAKIEHSEDELNEYMSSVLTLSTLATIVIFLISFVVSSFFPEIFGIPRILLYFMLFNVLFNNAFNLLQSQQRAQMKYKPFVTMSVITAILSPLLSIGLILLMEENKYLGRIFGSYLPTMLFGVVIFIYIMYRGKSYTNKKHWKYGLSYSLPLIPHDLSNMILNQSDRLILNYYQGPSQVGLYSLAYSYSAVLSTIWNSFNSSWAPWFLQKMKDESYDEIRRAVKPYTILFSMIFITMIALGPEGIRIFAPPDYAAGLWVVPPVLLGLYFQFSYSLYVNTEFYYKKTKFIAIGTLSTGIFDLILNFMLIPRYGYLGASYSTLLGYMILFVMHYFIANSLLEKDVIGNKFMVTWSILMVLMTVLFMFLYDYFWIRMIALIVLLLLIMYPQRKGIMNIIKTAKNRRKKK